MRGAVTSSAARTQSLPASLSAFSCGCQGCPGFDGGPGMELAQAGIGFHCLDNQE